MTSEQQAYINRVDTYLVSVMRGGSVRYDTENDANNVYVYVTHPDVVITTQGGSEIYVDMQAQGVHFFPGMMPELLDPVLVRRALAHVLVDEICATPSTAFVGSPQAELGARPTPARHSA
jgi:hypothetical protein